MIRKKTSRRKKKAAGRKTSKKKTAKKRTSKKRTTKARVAKKRTSKKKAAKKRTTKKKATKKKAAKKRTTKKKATKKKAAKKRTTKKKATKKKAAKKKATKKKTAKKKAAKKKTTKKKVAKKKVAGAKSSAKSKSAAAAEAPAKAPKKKKRKEPDYAAILKRLPYRESDYVVHPRYGLGQIRRIAEHTMNNVRVPCFNIHFSYQEMRLTIPVDQVEKSGLRTPMGRKGVDEVFKVLKGRATFDGKQRSAKRVADYQKRVHLGDPLSLAEVVRDLSRLSLKKTLSYEERKILSEAMRVLSREIALAKGISAHDVVEEIESIVNR